MSSSKTAIVKNKERYLELMNDRVFHYKVNLRLRVGCRWYLISIGPQCSDWICWECYHHEGSSWSILSGQIRSWNQARWSILSNSSCTNCVSAHCGKAISLENVALIACLQVEHCIEEWSTGVYVKAKFEESTSVLRYMAHLEKLVAWRELNPDVVDKILATMYKRCRYVHVL